MYYVISLKHTHKKDQWVTLWRPDNKGYCWPDGLAGQYETIEKGYHDSEGDNKPIPVEVLEPYMIPYNEHPEWKALPNCKVVIDFIKKYKLPHP